MGHFNIVKEVITEKNNYLVDFLFNNIKGVLITIYENNLGDKGKQLYIGQFAINQDTEVNYLIEQVKIIINKIEKPNNLKIDLAKWDGHIRYDITQEEKNETLEIILERLINVIDDASGLTDNARGFLLHYLDKFKGVR